MANVKIIGPVTKPDPTLKISSGVEYLLKNPKPTNRFWFAIDPEHGRAVGGLKLDLEGGATGRDITGSTVTVSDLSVEPNYQRQGIGQLLMETVGEWVLTQADLPHTIGLGVETDNEPAITLYRKLGYQIAEQAGDLVTFTGSDGKACYVMFAKLSS